MVEFGGTNNPGIQRLYGSVNSIAFSPDGKLVLAGVSDNTARLWKVAMPLADFLRAGEIDPLDEIQKKKFGIE
jgi:WD40 repeat protein